MLIERVQEYIQQWRDRPLKPLTPIGKYRIESVIGSGSYGIAYIVTHMETKKTLVAKQVKKSRMGKPKGVAMQQYEAKILRALHQQSNIPQFVELFADKNRFFLVMSYVRGHSLEDLLFEHQKTFSQQESLRLLYKVALIVQSLHEQEIIHRDVRIPNIILYEDEPYLIDFGLARFIGDDPTYESPDLSDYVIEKRLKREVHPRSDLYALGHLLLFLLYSSYEQEPSEEKSWEEELALDEPHLRMLRRLLQLDEPFDNIQQLLSAIETILEMNKKQ